MLKITDRSANSIRHMGVLLLVLGGALALWALSRFDQLPNYLRLATMLPLLVSVPMLWIDQYRNWGSVQGYWRGKAIGLLLAPPLVLLGAIYWYLADASAKV